MIIRLASSTIAVLAVGPTVRGQCAPEWMTPPGIWGYGSIRAFTIWKEALVAGGGNTIVTWDGNAWHTIGAGIQGWAYACAAYDGDLIVGGSITGAGGASVSRIAGWDGNEWYSLGTGIVASSSGGVRALVEYRGELYAGGVFTMAGGVSARNIARWNGDTWATVGTGANSDVLELTVFEGDLIAAGWFNEIGGNQFTSIGRWDGAVWYSMNLSLGAGQSVEALAVHEAELYAVVFVDFGYMILIRWNGETWDGFPATNEWAAFSLASYQGELVAGGSTPLGSGGSAIRRWTGTEWASLGAGIPYPGTVYAMRSYEGILHVGGNFDTAGGFPSVDWARWGCPCYPDCNNSGNLTVADFGCFQTQFVAAHPYADCNSDGALTVQDFGCFQTRFVAGCP